MVYGLAAALLPATRPARLAARCLAAAVLVELFRLVHAPWLDAFRFTTAGALLLGRVFSPWNMLFYAIGIATALGLDRRWPVRHRRPGVSLSRSGRLSQPPPDPAGPAGAD